MSGFDLAREGQEWLIQPQPQEDPGQPVDGLLSEPVRPAFYQLLEAGAGIVIAFESHLRDPKRQPGPFPVRPAGRPLEYLFAGQVDAWDRAGATQTDRKSTRLNSSHSQISYAVFCLKKKKI